MGAGIHCVHNCARSLTGEIFKQVRKMSARNYLWKAEGGWLIPYCQVYSVNDLGMSHTKS